MHGFLTKKRKYRNEPTTLDGIRFDSKKEAARWCELQLLARIGEIRDLRRQVRYPLHANGQKVGLFVADFDYFDVATAHQITEDVKSPATAKTRAFAQKKRHFEAEYGRKLKVTM